MIDGNRPHMQAVEQDYSAALDKRYRIDAEIPTMQIKAIEQLRPYLLEVINDELDYWASRAKEHGLSKLEWDAGMHISMVNAVRDKMHDELRSWKSMEHEIVETAGSLDSIIALLGFI